MFTPITDEHKEALTAAVVQAGAAYYGVPEAQLRALLRTPAQSAVTLTLSECDLWHITTALGEYRDRLLQDMQAEPGCRTYRRHLQETVSLLDNLANL